ncbi:hypothetical protein WKV44_00565 [Spirochaetia bacterium 38H-sp]|uniref:ResB-like domain-containing protein n=1 Tax=Rarispira pelagica TaxID=3141764 RepID=A0ABU9U8N2_9SPIR
MSRTLNGALKTAAAGLAAGVLSALASGSSIHNIVLSGIMLALGLSLIFCMASRLVKGESFRGIKSIAADVLHLGIVLVIIGLAIYMHNPPARLIFLGKEEGFKIGENSLLVSEIEATDKKEVLKVKALINGKVPVVIEANLPCRLGDSLVYLWTYADSRIILDIHGEKQAVYSGQSIIVGDKTITMDKEAIYYDTKKYAIFPGTLSEGIKITAYQREIYAGLLIKRTSGSAIVFAGILFSLVGLILLGIAKIKILEKKYE